ncbi:MAG: hypothetical protein GXX79_08380 [Actinomycetales bacterium]|nr:hypothetical protein [Actinomycetales bacterium]
MGPLTVTAVQQGPDPDRVTPGLAGFLVVFLLAVITLLLVRSMVRHLRKVRYGPAPDDRLPADGGGGAPVGGDVPVPAEPSDGGGGRR